MTHGQSTVLERGHRNRHVQQQTRNVKSFRSCLSWCFPGVLDITMVDSPERPDNTRGRENAWNPDNCGQRVVPLPQTRSLRFLCQHV